MATSRSKGRLRAVPSPAPETAEHSAQRALLADERFVAGVVRIAIRRRLACWPGRRIDTDDEDDITNLVLTSFYADDARVLSTFDPASASAQTFLRFITRLRVIELERRTLRRTGIRDGARPPLPAGTAPQDPDAWFQYFETRDVIIGWLNKHASREDKEIFMAAFVREPPSSNSDIAEELGVSTSHVADRKFAIRDHVKRVLEASGVEVPRGSER